MNSTWVMDALTTWELFFFVVVIAALTLLLVAYGSVENDIGSHVLDCVNYDGDTKCTEVAGHLYRFIDPEAGVVCWMFAVDGEYGGQGGMSCLPLDQTQLLRR